MIGMEMGEEVMSYSGNDAFYSKSKRIHPKCSACNNFVLWNIILCHDSFQCRQIVNRMYIAFIFIIPLSTVLTLSKVVWNFDWTFIFDIVLFIPFTILSILASQHLQLIVLRLFNWKFFWRRYWHSFQISFYKLLIINTDSPFFYFYLILLLYIFTFYLQRYKV